MELSRLFAKFLDGENGHDRPGMDRCHLVALHRRTVLFADAVDNLAGFPAKIAGDSHGFDRSIFPVQVLLLHLLSPFISLCAYAVPAGYVIDRCPVCVAGKKSSV